MTCPRILQLTVILAASTLVSWTDAQDSVRFELDAPSLMETGCTGPSPCDCLVKAVGGVQGTFLLNFFDLEGSFEVYLVDEVNWVVNEGEPTEITVTGTGIYKVNLDAQMQEMALSLQLDGIPREFQSIGIVPGGGQFPEQISIDIFSQIDPSDKCLYDGFSIDSTASTDLLRRGDCNRDGSFNIADAIFGFGVLFSGEGPPSCEDACDGNDDGTFDIADMIYLLNNLFRQGDPPPPPYPGCGLDPTVDDLDCESFPQCL